MVIKVNKHISSHNCTIAFVRYLYRIKTLMFEIAFTHLML